MMGDDTLRAVGIDPKKDIKHIAFGKPEITRRALKEKKVDAILTSLGGAALQEVKATVGIKALPFSQKIYDALRPEMKKMVMMVDLPAGYVIGVEKDQPVFAWPKFVACRADFDEQSAYTIVKTFMEHGRELAKVSGTFRETAIKKFALPDPASIVVPLHPGAVKYFKEAGLWSAAYEARQQELLNELSKLR
jgi:TRAP transporter TAXI family solute receptor